MKIVFSFLALLAAFVMCSDDALAQAHKQGYLPEGAKTRVGKGFVYAIAFSPDSTKFAVASSIGVWVYDKQTGETLDFLTSHTDRVHSVCFSPDGSTLASGSLSLIHI